MRKEALNVDFHDLVRGADWDMRGDAGMGESRVCGTVSGMFFAGGALMAVDVFCRVYAGNLIRLGMAMTTVERLMVDAEAGNIRLKLLVADGSMAAPHWAGKLIKPLERFHIEAKRYAEATAKSDIYVVFDDDQLILGKDWLDKGLRVMEKHPEVGMASAWMITGEVPEGDKADEHFWESGSIGCPYFVRKGILIDTPETPIAGYDTDLTNYVKSKGWKTGFMRHVRYNHLGSRYSQLGLQLGYGWCV